MNLVPNKEIREAVQRSGLSLLDVAYNCGWTRKDGSPDTTKVTRILGLSFASSPRNGKKYKNARMSEDNALAVIKAINLDPVDFRDIGL